MKPYNFRSFRQVENSSHIQTSDQEIVHLLRNRNKEAVKLICKGERGFQPGSVGKLAVATAFFCELENVYPDSFAKRQLLLKTKSVKGGPWALYDEHTVPFFDPETIIRRPFP